MLKVCTNADILQQYMIHSDFYEREIGRSGLAAAGEEYDMEKEFNEECESLSQITQLPTLGEKEFIEECKSLSQISQLPVDGDSLQVYFAFK